MFGELVAAYLFLAGVGAGGMAAASLADLLFVKAPFGAAAESSVAEAPAAERLVSLVLAAALGALAIGVGCLAADLGRIDRVLALFLTPAFTLMNVGRGRLRGFWPSARSWCSGDSRTCPGSAAAQWRRSRR